MKPDAKDIYSGLLQHNYFPFQKQLLEELPPVFSTTSFTPDVANALSDLQLSRQRCRSGFDLLEYRATRFNGVARIMAIPHPVPYARMSNLIHRHWSEIDRIADNQASKIKPEVMADGRILSMDYGNKENKMRLQIRARTNRRYLVKTDISNCFPSVYTHAIPWAIVGIEEAKRNRREGFHNELDTLQRSMKRNETTGIPIGPASSNIVSEIILEKVDQELVGRYDYVRHIDDYECFTDTEQQAQTFIQELSSKLHQYKLQLNLKKTTISKMPVQVNPDWLRKLKAHIPTSDQMNPFQVVEFLDLAQEMQAENPDGSIIKYAAKAIRNKLTDRGRSVYIEYLYAVALHYPIVIPLLYHQLRRNPQLIREDVVKQLLNENMVNRRDDMVCWLLHILALADLLPEQKQITEVVASDNVLAKLMLYGRGFGRAETVASVEGIEYNYDRDQIWPLLYHMYIDGVIPYEYEHDSFEIMNRAGVRFINLQTQGD